jgi:hypothetical protein
MRGNWFTLDDQLSHTQFTTALLGQLWHQLWIDNEAGLELFTEILPVLVVTDQATADAAAGIVDTFVETFDPMRSFQPEFAGRQGWCGRAGAARAGGSGWA